MGKSLLSSASLAFVLVALIGCKAAEVLDTANRAMDVVDGDTTAITSSRSIDNPNYVQSKENINIGSAERQKRDYGNIILTTERNPKGLTSVRFVGKHLDSGANISTVGYFYTVSPEGWLSKRGTFVASSPVNINSGTYYLKAGSNDGDFYTVGEVTLKRGVTNILTLGME
jgi:hypothetical protein